MLGAGGAMFAILAGHTIAETVRDALFLGNHGPRSLAFVYLLLAGIAMIAVVINAQLVRRLGRRYALVATLVVATGGSLAFALVGPSPHASFALYLWTGLLGTVVIVQFWLLAATMFTTTEAKRLYGPIAGAGAVGTLAGAVGAWALLHVLAPAHLLIVTGGCYLAAAALLLGDRGGIESRLRPTRVAATKRAPRPPAGSYVRRLAILAICATAAALLADYLLKATAAAALRPDQLPRFFARYNGVVSAISLALQVFGATWLVRRIGVLGMVVLLPLVMFGGGVAAVVTAGAFAAVAVAKGGDASLRYSVTRVATELLWMPVADDVRVAVREPLESVVARLVQAVIAVLLLGLVALGLVTPTVIAALLAATAGMWLATAVTMRTSYLAQLRRSVSRRSLQPHHELDLRDAETVAEALSSDDDARVIAAIQILTVHKRTRLIPALVLRHDSPAVLAAALDAIAVPSRSDWQALANRLLQQPSPEIRMLALRALARAGETTAIFNGLADHDPAVIAHAVFWKLQLAPLLPSLEDPAAVALLAQGPVARLQLLEAIRKDGDRRWTDAMLAIADDAPLEPLALAIARVPDSRFVPLLLAKLGSRAGRVSVRAALVAIGAPALDALVAALADDGTATPIRLHLPKAIAQFGNQQAAVALGAQLARERSGAVRYRVLRALARLAVDSEIILPAPPLLTELHVHLREHFRLRAIALPLLADTDPQDSAVLLRGLLADKISQSLDRAFLALQSLHPREAIREIERAVAGADRRARAHAVELLDTLTRSPLYRGEVAAEGRRGVMLLGEDLEPRELLARAGHAAEIAASIEDGLARLIHESDTLLAACAGYHALQLRTLAGELDEVVAERPLFAPLGIVYAGAHGR